MVIVPDYISHIIKKGEYQPLYYNPGELFDEVHILLTNADNPDPNSLKHTVGRAKLFLYNLPEDHRMHRKPWQIFDTWLLKKWAEPAVKLAEEIGPNLIRCHGADMNCYAAHRIKQKLGIPYVVSLHINADINMTRRWLVPDPTPVQRKQNTLFEYVERTSLNTADLVMPVYKPILPYLERMGAPNVEVCYNVLNIEKLVKKDNYKLNRPVKVICIGRLFEQKNPDNIIRAIAQMDNIEFTIVGDGPIRPNLESLARELGVEGRIHFRPTVHNDELCTMLPTFDVFAVHTEFWEINKSVLEVLLTGLPIIINVRRGLPVPELMGDFVYKVDNTVESYLSALQKLVSDDSFREQLGRKAYEHANANWAPKVTERKFVEIYKRISGIQNSEQAK